MNNEMTKLENVRKSCKTALTVVTVLSWILRVVAGLTLVGAIIMFTMGDKIDEAINSNPEIMDNVTISASSGPMDVTVPVEEMIDDGQYAVAFGTLFIFVTVIMILALILFRMISKIFKTILASGSPFEEVVIRTIKKSFIVLTIYVVLLTGLGEGALVGVFFWCIYTIFQYGAQLQKQADETL